MLCEKTLILIDTNKARNVLGGSPRYDTFEFGKEFNELNSFITENNLTEWITFAITEMTLKELLSQKKKVYEQDISNLNIAVTRLRNLDNVTIPEITLPGKDFNCVKILEPKVSEFLQKNKIHLIRIINDKKSLVFDVLIEKVIDIRPPFKQGRNNSCSGNGFKDAVIWETLKQSEIIKKYSNIVLLTSDRDFDGCEKEIKDINIQIITSTEYLIQELSTVYSQKILEKKYEKIIHNQYLLDKLKQLIAEEINSQPNDVTIISITEKIIDNHIEIKDIFSSLDQEELYFEGMFALESKVKIKNKKYLVISLIDPGANEIETLQLEGI